MDSANTNKYIILNNGKEYWLDPVKVAKHSFLEAHFTGPGRNGTVTIFGDPIAVNYFVNWVHYGDTVLNKEVQRFIFENEITRVPELSATHEKLHDIFDYFNLLVNIRKPTRDCTCYVREVCGATWKDDWFIYPAYHLYTCGFKKPIDLTDYIDDDDLSCTETLSD
jgi:hypothetical protein